MNNRKAMKLASRGKRFGAFCIDSVIPAVISVIFMISAIIRVTSSIMHMNDFGYGYGFPDYGFGYGYGYGTHSQGTSAAMIISLLLGAGYVVAQLVFFSKSSTIGKYALGLQVVSSKDGEPIGFWMMLFREWFVKQASGAVFLLGYIWILIDERNRGWHDKILDTYVVDLKETEAMNIRHASHQTGNPSPGPLPEPSPVYQYPGSETAGETTGSMIEVAEAVVLPAEDKGDAVQYDNVYAQTKETLTADDTSGGIPEEADSEENEQE